MILEVLGDFSGKKPDHPQPEVEQEHPQPVGEKRTKSAMDSQRAATFSPAAVQPAPAPDPNICGKAGATRARSRSPRRAEVSPARRRSKPTTDDPRAYHANMPHRGKPQTIVVAMSKENMRTKNKHQFLNIRKTGARSPCPERTRAGFCTTTANGS